MVNKLIIKIDDNNFTLDTSDPKKTIVSGKDMNNGLTTFSYTNNKVEAYCGTKPDDITFSYPNIEFDCTNVLGQNNSTHYLITCDFI